MGLLDASAEALLAGAPVFTRRNLFHAVRRTSGAAMTQATFDATLRRRLARGPLPGLLPVRSRRRARPPLPAWEARMPAVLLVDRPAILALFLESGALASPDRVAVVCIDGTPASVVDWLKQAFAAGRRAPVLYVHDATTVVYPFTLEPLATLLSQKDAGSIAYTDLGLPPLGATARRFADFLLAGKGREILGQSGYRIPAEKPQAKMPVR